MLKGRSDSLLFAATDAKSATQLPTPSGAVDGKGGKRLRSTPIFTKHALGHLEKGVADQVLAFFVGVDAVLAEERTVVAL